MEDTRNQEEFSNEESIEEEEEQENKEHKPLKINTQELEDIQKEIQEMTKKIEHEKINLRICTERYDKKYATYCELQGKPAPMSKEDKERSEMRIARRRNITKYQIQFPKSKPKMQKCKKTK